MDPRGPSRPPERRREDPRLQQILELLEATRASVASMAGRMSVLEREVSRAREMREALKVDDMSREQRESFLELAEWWVGRREDAQEVSDRLQRQAQMATVLQGAIALTLAVLTLYTVIHH